MNNIKINPVLHIPIKVETLVKLKESRLLWQVNQLINAYLDEVVSGK